MKCRLQHSKHPIKLFELQLQDNSLGPKRGPEFPTHSLACLVGYLFKSSYFQEEEKSYNMEAYISTATGQPSLTDSYCCVLRRYIEVTVFKFSIYFTL